MYFTIATQYEISFDENFPQFFRGLSITLSISLYNTGNVWVFLPLSWQRKRQRKPP